MQWIIWLTEPKTFCLTGNLDTTCSVSGKFWNNNWNNVNEINLHNYYYCCYYYYNLYNCLVCHSLITHGFGTPAICAALSTFQTILSEMLNYLEKHSANKSTGTPDGNQINSNSEKTPLRKTNEAPSKDGKMEKTEWLHPLSFFFSLFVCLILAKLNWSCCWFETSWSELQWWWWW